MRTAWINKLHPEGPQLSHSSGDCPIIARHNNPSRYFSTDLELLRLPSSERFFAEPLFLDSQDFTPSTRSSNSESVSESPWLARSSKTRREKSPKWTAGETGEAGINQPQKKTGERDKCLVSAKAAAKRKGRSCGPAWGRARRVLVGTIQIIGYFSSKVSTCSQRKEPLVQTCWEENKSLMTERRISSSNRILLSLFEGCHYK